MPCIMIFTNILPNVPFNLSFGLIRRMCNEEPERSQNDCFMLFSSKISPTVKY